MSDRRFRIATAIGVVTLAVILFLVSPFFSVTEVVVTGYNRVSRTEIITMLGVDSSTNLLFFRQSAARQRVMENLYIGDVIFERALPGRLYVMIQERRLTAYVEHMPGSFLFLDDTGRVLEIRTYFAEPLPVLVGLDFTRFRLGEVLEVPDTVSFGAVVQYAQLLNTHGLIHQVSHMNVSDSENIRIMIGHKEFNVGGIIGADVKVRTIVEILEVLPNPELMRGFATIRHNSFEHFFEIMQ